MTQIPRPEEVQACVSKPTGTLDRVLTAIAQTLSNPEALRKARIAEGRYHFNVYHYVSPHDQPFLKIELANAGWELVSCKPQSDPRNEEYTELDIRSIVS